jgi:hypothetical protein
MDEGKRGFPLRRGGVKEEPSSGEQNDSNTEADILLASLLQNGGLLAKPTVSPHYGRFYPPPRHDPFIRPEAPEGQMSASGSGSGSGSASGGGGMDVEDKI